MEQENFVNFVFVSLLACLIYEFADRYQLKYREIVGYNLFRRNISDNARRINCEKREQIYFSASSS